MLLRGLEGVALDLRRVARFGECGVARRDLGLGVFERLAQLGGLRVDRGHLRVLSIADLIGGLARTGEVRFERGHAFAQRGRVVVV